MFFTYPLAATAENWISVTLLEVLKLTVENLQNEEEPAAFNASIPEAYRDQFARGRKFPELYDAFVDSCRHLDADQRDAVLAALVHQNDFPGLFAANGPSPSLADALPDVHQAAKALFEYAFSKVSDLKTPNDEMTVRARYHQVVHEQLPGASCPFCGLEILEEPDPDLAKPDLDHYLAVSRYPFAGANLRNLTAMGTTCNRSYKGALDILFNELGQRVACIDPYGQQVVTCSLARTLVLSGGGEGPAWVLDFTPDVLSQNWRRIFRIEARLRANVLQTDYMTWLGHFVSYARRRGVDFLNRVAVVSSVRDFKDTCAYERLLVIARLKAEFFDLIDAGLNDPQVGDRMHNFVAALASE